ncbi:MAG: hypothetical protein DSY57_06330, partial [Desulfobulbus sp.]
MTNKTITLAIIGLIIYIALAMIYSSIKKHHPLTEHEGATATKLVNMEEWQNQSRQYQEQLATLQTRNQALQEQLKDLEREKNQMLITMPSTEVMDRLKATLKEKKILEKDLQDCQNRLQRTKGQVDQSQEEEKKSSVQLVKKPKKQVNEGEVRIQKLIESQDILAGKYQTLLQQDKSLKSKLNEILAENKALKQENLKLSTTNQQLNQTLASIETKNKDLTATAKEHIAALTGQVKKYNTELTAANKAIKELKDALAEARMKLANDDKIQQEKDNELEQCSAQIQQQSTEIGNLKARLTDAVSQLALVRESLKKADLKAEAMLRYGQQKDQLLAPSTRQISDLEQKLKEKETELAQAREELAAMKKELAAKPNVDTELQQQCAKIQQQLVEKTAAFEESEKNLVDLRGQLARLQEEQEKELAERQQMVRDLASMTESTDVFKNEITGLKEQLEKANATITDLTGILEQTKTELAQTKEELAKTVAARDELQQTLAAETEKLAQTQEEIAKLIAERNQASQQLAAANNEIASLKEQETAVQQKFADLQANAQE